VYVSLFRITDDYFSIFYTFYKTSIVKELLVHASPDPEESSLFTRNYFLSMHTKILAFHP